MEEPGGLQSRGCKESETTERLHFTFLYVVLQNATLLGDFSRKLTISNDLFVFT